MKLSLITGVAVAAAVVGGAAHAQSAGNWSVSIGANKIAPKVKSGDLSAPSLPGTKIDVKDATAGFATFTYMLTDNVALQTFLGGPYKHDIVGAGAIDGVGKIGEVRQVSPTVVAQVFNSGGVLPTCGASKGCSAAVAFLPIAPD